MKQSKTNYIKQNKNPTALESSLTTSTRQQVVDVLTLYKTNTHTHKQLRIETNKQTVFRFWQLSNFGVVQFPKFIIDRRYKTVCCTVRTQTSVSYRQSVKCTHAQGQILTSVNALLVLCASWILSVLSHSAQTLLSVKMER